MTDQVEKLGSLDGLETVPTFRVFTVAGHQVVFSYDIRPLEMDKHTSIYVKGLGRVTFTSKVSADGYRDGVMWLESLNDMTARKAAEYLWSRVRTK